MSRTFDIPIISRGRIIPPGPDAIEFKGRTGAIFRAPDPKKHVGDLVLGDPGRLRDLQETPVREIVDFLAELGQRLAFDRNPYLQEAFELSLEAGGLTEPVLRAIYAGIPHMFDRAYLTELVEKTVGIDYLDGWVPQGTGPRARFRVRAVGTRQLHITAGNVPVVGAVTITRTALTKSDCLIKLPSNDPLSAVAIARTMIEIDPDHPVTRHVAVAYWKGGDEAMESQICRTSRIDKITAWGGMASVKHIQKFLSPGIDLIALNPKLSMSLVGKEALESPEAMQEAAAGVAMAAGKMNQTACVNTRVVYVESETDDASLERVIALGQKIYEAFQLLPPEISTPAPRPNRELESEMRALELEEELYWVIGDTLKGGVIVSRFSDRVDFHGQLNNRVVNLVPMPDLAKVTRWCDDTTQTVGVYPESLRYRLRDALALAGVQRMVPLALARGPADEGAEFPGMPHDGIEPMRRGVRWVIDEAASAKTEAVKAAAE
ncbi:aldehyde dehydrogenase family protein [Phenylobacterium sp. LjRoot225]|uniref:acyl-CoA reductase n=1 Tax=Phenylobacterium sp. LjRoot225 TaxID=3342285 RepID=UPI003ECC3A61